MTPGPWDEQPITERVAQPCPWCGSPSLRLRPCPLPPLTMAFAACIYSGDYDDPHWRLCARSKPGRYSGRFDPTPVT